RGLNTMTSMRNSQDRRFGMPRAAVRWALVAIALSLLVVACSSDQGSETTTTTVEIETDLAVMGQPCSPPGRFAQTSDGDSAICSATTAEGEALATPVWRLASGDAFRGLTDDQEAAVGVVRSAYAAHPGGGEWPADDETTLLFVNEIAAATRVASQQELVPAETFNSLVNGYAGANGVGSEEATAAITGLLLGVTELFEGETAGDYASEMLEAVIDSVDE
ncbi:MAG: hypothetical protein PVJ28_05360, partial [Acidimicrobiia bacterium]